MLVVPQSRMLLRKYFDGSNYLLLALYFYDEAKDISRRYLLLSLFLLQCLHLPIYLYHLPLSPIQTSPSFLLFYRYCFPTNFSMSIYPYLLLNSQDSVLSFHSITTSHLVFYFISQYLGDCPIPSLYNYLLSYVLFPISY